MKCRGILLALLSFCVVQSNFCQTSDTLPEFHLLKKEFEPHLRYLASDELQGRQTGTEGNEMAAAYIAQKFEEYGLVPPEGMSDYYQKIPFNDVDVPAQATFIMEQDTFNLGKDFLQINGSEIDTIAKAVFAGYGWVDESNEVNDYKDIDINGKVVFVLPGTPESSSPFAALRARNKKRQLASERGAIALIELYRIKFPWGYFKNFVFKKRLEIGSSPQEEKMVYAWLKEKDQGVISRIKEGEEVSVKLQSTGVPVSTTYSSNVIGMLKGSDETLKDEYLALTAHYDHVGTMKSNSGKEDTIFNGARDNAFGTVALLAAAKSLSLKPPKRSILFIGFTAEEIGLLGSKYYVDNPVVPLNKTVFNLNNDGGGYNSTEHVVTIGYGRTGTDKELDTSAEAVGLKMYPNPMPEENLFDRSDNVSFAIKGVPCVDYAPGALSMDAEVRKYYHQVEDNPDSVDYDYLLKFCKAYSHAARLIANKSTVPRWTKGDKYESAGIKLYNLEEK